MENVTGSIEMSTELFCNVNLKRPFWKQTELGVGKVCNTKVAKDGTCPNAERHMTAR